MNNNIEEALWKDYGELGDLISVMGNDDERKRGVLEERDKIRNRITIVTFGISTAISLYAIVKTFRFDQDSTVTSTLGRNILNSVIPKLFKK